VCQMMSRQNRMRTVQGILLISFLTAATLGAASDISRKWHFVMKTPGSDREISADLLQAGEQVSGKWDGADVKGTFKEGALELVFPYASAEAGTTGDCTLKGTMKDGGMTGSWEYGQWSGTFTAARVASGQ
jgi:hypothetical protein